MYKRRGSRAHALLPLRPVRVNGLVLNFHLQPASSPRTGILPRALRVVFSYAKSRDHHGTAAEVRGSPVKAFFLRRHAAGWRGKSGPQVASHGIRHSAAMTYGLRPPPLEHRGRTCHVNCWQFNSGPAPASPAGPENSPRGSPAASKSPAGRHSAPGRTPTA
jgi:hypothetical protein